MAVDGAKAAWVARVLGYTPPAAAAPSRGPKQPLIAIWREAKEEVDAGISSLQGKLRQHGHPVLKRIADGGMNGVTDRNSVGIMAALMEAESSPAARAKAAKAVASFRAFLATEIAEAIDDNPFGVTIGLRDTLGRALDDIDQRLAA
jgi:hypothetical protein